MKTLLFILCFISCFFASNSFASYYCMETNQVVNEGDPMEKVQAACGTPTRVYIKDVSTSIPVEVTDWVYMTRPVDPTKTQDYWPYLTVIFNNQGKVTEIRQSQISPPTDSIATTCKVGAINVGDDAGAVLSACGNPTLINRRKSSEDISSKVVEWIYEKGAYVAPLKFRFESGILRQIG